MRFLAGCFCGIMALGLRVAPVCGQSIQAMVLPERGDSLLIGDPLPLVFVVQAPKGVSVRLPSIEAQLLQAAQARPQGEEYLELVDAQDVQTRQTDDFNVFEQRFRLTAWNQGDYELPPLVCIAEQDGRADSVFSAPLRLRVRFPVSPTGDSTFVADIKPVMEEPVYWSDYLIYLWISLGALVALGLGWWLWRLLRHAGRKPPIVATPEEQALQGLERLLAGYGGDEARLHEGVSQLLRLYVKQRYELPALERSTPEMRQLLCEHSVLGSLTEALTEVLHTADLVKFAKASPLPAAKEFALNTLRQTVSLYTTATEQTKNKASVSA